MSILSSLKRTQDHEPPHEILYSGGTYATTSPRFHNLTVLSKYMTLSPSPNLGFNLSPFVDLCFDCSDNWEGVYLGEARFSVGSAKGMGVS